MIALIAALALQPAHDEAFDMVVTAQRPNSVPFDPPSAFFRRHCYEPLRRSREAEAPTPSDTGWQILAEDVREDLGVTDPATVLLALTDHVRRHRLVLRIDRMTRDDGLTERRCVLTVIGGDSHGRAQADLASMFRAPGTDRHVGQPMGTPRLDGWQQHAWTLMPMTGSSTWRDGSPRRSGGSFLVVTDRDFYRTFDYVLGDLKVRTGDRPVSIMSLAVTSRRPL